MDQLNEDFFIGDSRNASEKNGRKPSSFPSQFKCVVCDLDTVSLLSLHQHQTTDHKPEELSLSIIALQSYIYHKEYFESNQPPPSTSGSKIKCRFSPFCSELGPSIEGDWKPLLNPQKKSDENDEIQFIKSLENPAIPPYKLTKISSSPALRKPGTKLGGDTARSPPIPAGKIDILESLKGTKQLEKIKTMSKPTVKRIGTATSKPLRRPNIGAGDKSKSPAGTLEERTSTSPAGTLEERTSISPAGSTPKPVVKVNKDARRPMWKPLKPHPPKESAGLVDMDLSKKIS